MKEHESWWQGSVPPWGRTWDTVPHQTNIEYYSKWSFQFVYYIQHSTNVTMCSIEKRTNLWLGQWPNIMSTISQCFLSKWGQIYGQDSDPNISYKSYNMTTLKGGNLPLLWYLGNVNPIKFWKESKESREPKKSMCFVKIFIPWPYPAYPETSLTLGMPRGHTYCPIHCKPSGGCPTARDCPTVTPAYPSFRNRHTHGIQCTQQIQTTRLHSQLTESITKKPRGGKYRESPAEAIQRKAWQRGKVKTSNL